MLEGVGANRSALATEHAPIVYSGTSINPCIDETNTLTLVVANQAVPSAQITIDLYYALGA